MNKYNFFILLIVSPLLLSSFYSSKEDIAILKSDSLYRIGEYKAAIQILQNRLSKTQENNDQDIQIVLFNSLGKSYSQLGQSIAALQSYQKAIKLAEQKNDKISIGKILKNMGALYEEQKNFDQALSYYNKSEKIAIEIKDESLLADCYNNKGVVYEQQLQYTKALEVYQKALKIYRKLKKHDRIALALNNIGIVYKFLNNYSEAINYYNLSLEFSERIGDQFFVAANLNNIGNVYALMHNYHKAIDFNTRSLKIAESINATNIIVEAYGSLSEDYAGLGDFKKAYELNQKYVKANSDYINIEQSKQLAEMQTLYETEKKEREINSLKKDKEISTLNIAKQKLIIQKRDYQIVFIAAIVLCIATFSYLLFRKQKIKQLLTHKKAVLIAENKERMRIAKDVHDDIGSGLSKITLMAEMFNNKMSLSGKEDKEMLNISHISKDLVENMRDLIWVLTPENSTLDNLVARIREYCSDYLEGLKVKSTFAIQDEVPQIYILQQAQRNIFLTIKEALHNCIKHANCEKINIILFCNDELLYIVIEDSGKGFSTDDLKRKGNGLYNMKDRIESIGGKFEIVSAREEGTKVKIEVSLQRIKTKNFATTT